MDTKAASQPDIIHRLGGARKIARMLDISTTAVYCWEGQIPPRAAFRLEALTGIPAQELVGPKYLEAKSDTPTS